MNPQRCASAGLLNQNPRWNVFVGEKTTSLSTPKIWSSRTVRTLALPDPSVLTCRSDSLHREPDARVDVGSAAGGLRAVLDREQVEVQVRLEPRGARWKLARSFRSPRSTSTDTSGVRAPGLGFMQFSSAVCGNILNVVSSGFDVAGRGDAERTDRAEGGNGGDAGENAGAH